MKICKNCEHQNISEAKYCVRCGNLLLEQNTLAKQDREKKSIHYKVCSNCTSINHVHARFCRRCGTEFTIVETGKNEKCCPIDEVYVVEPVESSFKNSKRIRKAMVFLGVLTIFLIAGAVGYYFAFMRISKKLIYKCTIGPMAEEQKIVVENIIELQIPPYFTDKDRELKIYRVRNMPDLPFQTTISDAFDIQLEGMQLFEQAVYCIIPLQSSVEAKNITVGYYNEQKKQWEQVPYLVNKDNRKLEFRTQHFSIFAWGTVDHSLVHSPLMQLPRVPYPAGQMLQEHAKTEILSKHSKGIQPQSAVLDGWNVFMEWAGITEQISAIGGDLLKQPVFESINVLMPEISLGFALVQAGIDFKDGNTNKATLELTKNIANYYADKFINTVSLNVAMVGVFAIDYSLNKFAQVAISSRNEIYERAYRKYYIEYNKNHKVNTVWWYKQFNSIIKKSKSAKEAKEKIEKLINKYVYQFWENEVVIAEYLEKEGLYFTGGGGLNENLKKELSENHKSELIHVFHQIGMIERLKKEYAFEAAQKLYRHLEIIRDKLNKIFFAKIKVESEQEDFELKELPVFFKIKNAVYSELWKVFTDDEGKCEFSFTLLGYLDAGCPKEVCVEVEENGKQKYYCSEFKLSQSSFSVTIIIGEPKLEGIYQIEILGGKIYHGGKVISQFTKADIQRSYNLMKQYQQDMPKEFSTGEYGLQMQQGVQAMGMIAAEKYPLNFTEVSKKGSIRREGKFYIIQYSEPVRYYGGTTNITYKIQFTNPSTFEGTCEIVTSVHGSTSTTVYEIRGYK